MDPLNFTTHGMSKSFAELLTPKIDIVNKKKRLENEQIMTQKTKKSSSGGQHSKLLTLKFSLDPLNLGFAVPKGSGKIQLGP